MDAAETVPPESDAVLLGNIIVKAPHCTGNQDVIHFGSDGGSGTTARFTWHSIRSSPRSCRR